MLLFAQPPRERSRYGWPPATPSSADTYAVRVAALFGPPGGLNGNTFLSSGTVGRDGVANRVTGGPGNDWFLLSSGDGLTDYAGEFRTFI